MAPKLKKPKKGDKAQTSPSAISTRTRRQTTSVPGTTETQAPAVLTPDEEVTAILGQNMNVDSIEVIDAPMLDPSEADVSAQEEEGEEEPEASQPVGKQRGKKGKRRNVLLTDEQKEEVREFLIRNEGLFNKRKELWQQPHKKNELWQEQGRAMGVDWKDIFTWYETQRRRLGRLKSLAAKSGSGSLEDTWKETDLEFWNQWHFLHPHINIQSQEPVVSLRRRLASAPAKILNPEAGPSQDNPEDEADCEDHAVTCLGQITPTTTGNSTPVSTATQPSRRSSQTNEVDRIMDALVASSERHQQLINMSESLLKSQQVPVDHSKDRHQFNLWCGSLLQEFPQDLYEQCEAEMFRLLTHYRNLAHQRPSGRATPTPLPHQAPSQQPQQTQQTQQSYSQAGWQPHPSKWTPNPPAASSVWHSQGCDYMTQYQQQQQRQPLSSSSRSTNQSLSSLLNCSLLNDEQLFPPPPSTTADMATAPATNATATVSTFRAITTDGN